MVFAGQDAWRKHPMLTGCYRRPFPGFGYAVAIFAGYCVVDGAVNYITGEWGGGGRQGDREGGGEGKCNAMLERGCRIIRL